MIQLRILREILEDEAAVREVMVKSYISLQRKWGIKVTKEQAEREYDRVLKELDKKEV